MPNFWSYPRVKTTSTTTGTGTLTLGSAVAGFQAFSAVGDGLKCWYFLEAVDTSGVPTGDWEEGYGTYTSSGTTLSRTVVSGSSNSGALVSLAAGTKRVDLTFSSVQCNQVVVAANLALATGYF